MSTGNGQNDGLILLLTLGLLGVAVWNGINNKESLEVAKETQHLIVNKGDDDHA